MGQRNTYLTRILAGVLRAKVGGDIEGAPKVHGESGRPQLIEGTALKMVEAGGVEPPSEKRYGSKTTCLSHSIWFASRAWNAQDALLASPINLAGKPRTEVHRPAYCVTPRSQPVGEAGGNGLR